MYPVIIEVFYEFTKCAVLPQMHQNIVSASDADYPFSFVPVNKLSLSPERVKKT